MYILIVSSPDEADVQRFYDNFEFTPYQKVNWKSEEFVSDNFTIDLSGSYVVEEENDADYYTDYDSTKSISAKSFTDGTGQIIQIQRFKKFTNISDSLQLNLLSTDIGDYQDTILKKDTILFNGRTAVELVLKSDSGHTHLRIINFISKNKRYVLHYIGTKDEIYSKNAQHFFDSFSFIDTNNLAPAIFGEFRTQIISNLSSTDSLVQQVAIDAFYNLPDSTFTETQLIELLEKEYPNAGDSKSAVLEKIILKFDESNINDSTVNYLMDYYAKNDSLPEVQSSILNLLSGDKKTLKKSISLFFKQHPKQDSYNLWMFKSAISDSIELLQPHVTGVKSLISDSLYDSMGIDLIKKLFKDSIYDYREDTLLENILTNQFFKMIKAVEATKETEDYFYYPYYGKQILELLSNYKSNDTVLAAIDKVLADTEHVDEYMNLTCIILQNKWGETERNSLLEKYFTGYELRSTTYSSLLDEGLLHLLPQKLLTEKYLSAGYLSSYFEEDYGFPTSMKFEKEVKLICDEKKVTANVFEITFNWEEVD